MIHHPFPTFTACIKKRNMQYSLLFLLIFLTGNIGYGQKIMDESTYDIWNSIEETIISNNGDWVSYVVEPGKGDPVLHLYNTHTKEAKNFSRGSKAKFAVDNQHLIFYLSPAQDSINALKRKKVKEDDLPKDTMVIYNLRYGIMTKLANTSSLQIPEEWSGYIAYLDQNKMENDTIKTRKKSSKTNGYPLIIHRLPDHQKDTISYVTMFTLAETEPFITGVTTGIDSVDTGGVFLYSPKTAEKVMLFEGKGKFEKLVMNEDGSQISFIVDQDTTDALIRPFNIYHYDVELTDINAIDPSIIPDGWQVSPFYEPKFSEDGTRMFFGIKPQPILQDTSLLDEEIVNVEVWGMQGPLYTEMENDLSSDKKKSYPVVYDTHNKKLMSLGNDDYTSIEFADDYQGHFALAENSSAYEKASSWLGNTASDVYAVDMRTGEKNMVVRQLFGYARLSPTGRYIYWYDLKESAYHVYDPLTKMSKKVAGKETSVFYDELNDSPSEPYPYGTGGWIRDDQSILIYDRYDIWQIDPEGNKVPKNLTNGRKQQLVYRLTSLSDPDEDYVDLNKDIILHTFNDQDKSSGYSKIVAKSGKIETIIHGPYDYERRLINAKDSKDIIYTKESFQLYPDLILSDQTMVKAQVISNVNPQQSEYGWGSIELIKWKNKRGEDMTGMLVKPANFDPNKQYPMIVNFYDRSSDGLHRHRPPYPNRSTITYAFYANRGYVVFNPDIPYRIGYPGESCEETVLSGVEAVCDLGFVDRNRLALQGHSWGGYQIAYLLNKTGIFACAEAGAPVVNMTSAYGGIRWGSGKVRQFQYERQQSRIGATLWEKPELYIENSPLFDIEKITTPVLIMHNDADGHVPWHLGVEYYMALRRLNKTAWLLNYNGEPHWPLKRQNRIDFNTRLRQFFDYYLQDAAMPKWMENGVPPIEKGINQRLELIDRK